MKSFKQPILAFFLMIVCSAMVLGSISLSFAESGYALAQAGTPRPFFLLPGVPIINLVGDENQAVEGMTIGTASAPGEASIAVASESAVCKNIPSGWAKIVLAPDETLGSVARRYGVAVEVLKASNCLLIDRAMPGSEIFVPPLAAAAQAKPTKAVCYPRGGWVRYTVRPGDTLFSLGFSTGVTVADIMSANCLASAYLSVGQALLLPYFPVFSPVPTLPIFTATAVIPMVTPVYPSLTPVVPLVTPIYPSPSAVTPPTIVPPVLTTVAPPATTVAPSPATTVAPLPATTVPVVTTAVVATTEPPPPPVETTPAPPATTEVSVTQPPDNPSPVQTTVPPPPVVPNPTAEPPLPPPSLPPPPPATTEQPLVTPDLGGYPQP